MRGGIIGEKGVADEFGLFLRDDDWVCDIQQRIKRRVRASGSVSFPCRCGIKDRHICRQERLELAQKAESQRVCRRGGGFGEAEGIDFLGVFGIEGQVVVQDFAGCSPDDGIACEETCGVEFGG